MKKYIEKFLAKQDSTPGFLELWTNPYYFARKGLYEHIVRLAPYIHGKVLDVGCGMKPYAKIFTMRKYIGLEIDTLENRAKKKADYYYDGKSFPFGSQEFDSLITSQVFEHVFNPDQFLTEINRVLKDNGYLLLTVPFIWDEHEQPFDYARYSSFGIRHLLENHGFQIVISEKSIKDIRVVFQLLNVYIYKKLSTKNKAIKLLAMLFMLGPVNILGTFFRLITPHNEDLYLDNIILAKKVK